MATNKTVMVLSDCFISIDGVEYSGYGTSVAISRSVQAEEVRCMGDYSPFRLSNEVKDWTFAAELLADEDAIGADIFDMLGEKVEIEVRPKNEARSESNPAYVGLALINEATPLEGETGAIQKFSISGLASGNLERRTAVDPE
jgi:hypothetical protein